MREAGFIYRPHAAPIDPVIQWPPASRGRLPPRGAQRLRPLLDRNRPRRHANSGTHPSAACRLWQQQFGWACRRRVLPRTAAAKHLPDLARMATGLNCNPAAVNFSVSHPFLQSSAGLSSRICGGEATGGFGRHATMRPPVPPPLPKAILHLSLPPGHANTHFCCRATHLDIYEDTPAGLILT